MASPVSLWALNNCDKLKLIVKWNSCEKLDKSVLAPVIEKLIDIIITDNGSLRLPHIHVVAKGHRLLTVPLLSSPIIGPRGI